MNVAGRGNQRWPVSADSCLLRHHPSRITVDSGSLTQILDLFAQDSWRNVYAGQLEVRPPGAPTTGRETEEVGPLPGPCGLLVTGTIGEGSRLFHECGRLNSPKRGDLMPARCLKPLILL